jgi:hypothetical protein
MILFFQPFQASDSHANTIGGALLEKFNDQKPLFDIYIAKFLPSDGPPSLPEELEDQTLPLTVLYSNGSVVETASDYDTRKLNQLLQKAKQLA